MAGPLRPTFECSTTEIVCINVNRIHPEANRIYARARYVMTRHEQVVLRVARDVKCPLHITGLDTLSIMLRMFVPQED